jgi:hypothetical protein
MPKLTKQEAQTKLQAVQERIFQLRNKQSECSANERASIEAQIQAGYQLLDKLSAIANS